MDIEPMYPGFESRDSMIVFFLFFFILFFLCLLSLLLQCKFAISISSVSTQFLLLYTPYDAQASSAFSALIKYIVDLNWN